jgi:hypothetical protein
MLFNCPSCEHLIIVEYPRIIHAGFNDSGFLYCNTCGDLLTWSSYDVAYQSLLGGKPPWDLTEDEKSIIESHVVKCPCGGAFTFKALPRCPECTQPIPGIIPDRIHWVQLRNRIDGEKEQIWKTS